MAKDVDLLNLLKSKSAASGLVVVTVDSASAFKFEGSNKAVDVALFEIPASFQPLVIGDKFFTLPIVDATEGQRWGLITRLNR